MSKIEAWQCKHCVQIYIAKSDMEKCRRACVKRAKERLAAAKLRAEADVLANEMRLMIKDVNEIPRYIEEYVKKKLNRRITITDFNMRFRNNLAATHDAPIDKPHEFTAPDKGRTMYLGWDGHIKAEQSDLYKNKVKCNRATFGKCGGIGDLRNVIKGFNIRGGYGGNYGNYEVRLYLDDFPKIKERYNQWKLLADKHKVYIDKQKELIDIANETVICGNESLKDLVLISNILAAREKQVVKRRAEIIADIKSGTKYINATVVPKEFCFDEQKMHELGYGFN